jgi:hypothetical protein
LLPWADEVASTLDGVDAEGKVSVHVSDYSQHMKKKFYNIFTTIT